MKLKSRLALHIIQNEQKRQKCTRNFTLPHLISSCPRPHNDNILLTCILMFIVSMTIVHTAVKQLLSTQNEQVKNLSNSLIPGFLTIIHNNDETT